MLLQTAIVYVYNPEKSECSINIRAILDTGSQQSYASQCVKDALALQHCSKKTMSRIIFSSTEQAARACDVVKIGLVSNDGRRQELEMYIIFFI